MRRRDDLGRAGVALLVAGSILTLLFAVSLWSWRTFANSEGFADAATDALKEPAVAQTVADQIVDVLQDHVATADTVVASAADPPGGRRRGGVERGVPRRLPRRRPGDARRHRPGPAQSPAGPGRRLRPTRQGRPDRPQSGHGRLDPGRGAVRSRRAVAEPDGRPLHAGGRPGRLADRALRGGRGHLLPRRRAPRVGSAAGLRGGRGVPDRGGRRDLRRARRPAQRRRRRGAGPAPAHRPAGAVLERRARPQRHRQGADRRRRGRQLRRRPGRRRSHGRARRGAGRAGPGHAGRRPGQGPGGCRRHRPRDPGARLAPGHGRGAGADRCSRPGGAGHGVGVRPRRGVVVGGRRDRSAAPRRFTPRRLALGGTTGVATFSLVLLLGGMSFVRAVRAPDLDRRNIDEAGCNGFVDLCDRGIDEVAFAGTHNSMAASSEEGWAFGRQTGGLLAQLSFGVRAFLLDLHYGAPIKDLVRTDFLTPAEKALSDRQMGPDQRAALARAIAVFGGDPDPDDRPRVPLPPVLRAGGHTGQVSLPRAPRLAEGQSQRGHHPGAGGPRGRRGRRRGPGIQRVGGPGLRLGRRLVRADAAAAHRDQEERHRDGGEQRRRGRALVHSTPTTGFSRTHRTGSSRWTRWPTPVPAPSSGASGVHRS